MNISKAVEAIFNKYLPSPFTIAVLLTIVTIFLALLFTKPDTIGFVGYTVDILQYWEKGIWSSSLLEFAYQMMLILVLGHVLVLSKPISNLIMKITRYCNNTATSAAIVACLTMLVAFFNWGLGLIFGALLARKVAEHAYSNNIKLNYPIIGASGYMGMMVWHGGISGSAPIKINEVGHLSSIMKNTSSLELVSQIPSSINFNQTIFNSSNQPVGYGFPVNLTNELGESFIANDTSELTLLLEECDMTGTGTGGNFGTYSCYDIVFPVNFDLPDGTSFTVNSQDDFPSDFSFLQWTLGYPMTLFNPATGNLIANSEAELDDLLEDCTNIGNGGGNNVGSIVYSMTVITIENPDTTGTINIPDCYDYQYPISVIDINQNVQTANDDDAFIAIIQSGIEVEGFVYPISVIDTATGQTLTANSDDDVMVWINNCL